MAGTPSREAVRAASRLERTRSFRTVARTGYAVAGLLHVLIGIIAISIGVHADGGQADQSGALRSVAGAPGGIVLLVLMVVGLVALGLWQILRGVTAEKWGPRLSAWGQAIGYLFLGGLAISVAAGGGSSGGGTTLTAQVLGVPGGVVLIAAVGIGVFAGGVWFVIKGVTKKFLKDLEPEGRLRGLVETVGVVGHVAKGVALAVLGVLVVVAAVTADPDKAEGLDAAFQALARVPFGEVLVVLVGAGFIFYGVYSGFRARFARL